MDDLKERLTQIIYVAKNIRNLVTEDWYDLFMKEDGGVNWTAFNEESEEAYKLLGNIQDMMYTIIAGDDS